MFVDTVVSPVNNFRSRVTKAIAQQPFRRETGDGATILTKNGSVYKLDGVIGVGGLSVVYLATRYTDGVVVALKIANAEHGDTGGRTLIRRESSILSKLKHPNIIGLVEHGETLSGEPFMALDWMRGQTMDHLLTTNGGRLPLERAASICLQAAQALEYAHEKGVLHRDIKPSNIVVLTSHGVDRIKILDFGISLDKDQDKEGESEDSSGSLLYISPEQLAGTGCTRSSDVYQLALVLFEALTGELPFEISVEGALGYRRGDVPVMPEDWQLSHPLPRCIRDVLESALSLEPNERPCTMKLFAHELRKACLKLRMDGLKVEGVLPTVAVAAV